MVLIRLTQSLYLVNELFILLALHAYGDREPTDDQRRSKVVVLCDRLQVWDIQGASWFLKDIGEVLGHKPIQAFQGAETEDPVFRGLRRRTRWLPKVICIAIFQDLGQSQLASAA